MIDIMSGPNYPLTKAFAMSGWRVLAIDLLFGQDHDLSDLSNQVTIRDHFQHADFAWAALDCSDKSRIREIPEVQYKRNPRTGNTLPTPLRSEKFPMGLPDLQGYDKERVAASNEASEFILGELRLLQTRGGASGRENPSNSIHWYTPTEVQMMAANKWWDKFYDGCTLQGVRKKKQRIRHDVEEINLWPDMRCRHLHHPQEWDPQKRDDGSTWYPSKEEAEYTACLVFHIVYSVSAWACRVGKAKLAIPRRPPVECTGDRRDWLEIDPRAFRDWAMIPMALAVGLNISHITSDESHGVIPVRRQAPKGRNHPLSSDEVYIGHGHHSHRLKASKWASPVLVGQDGTCEECLIKYSDHISSSPLSDDLSELVGKHLLSDTPTNVPCTSDVLIAMVYYAWTNDLLNAQKDDQWIHGKKKAYSHSKWSKRALCMMAATTGDAWRSIYSEPKIWARYPPLALNHYTRWHQHSLTETFASYFPYEVFAGFNFPYIEDLVNLPAFNRYAEWTEERGKPPGRASPPSQVEKIAARTAKGAEGVQLSAFSHRAALPPIVSFGLDPDQHF